MFIEITGGDQKELNKIGAQYEAVLEKAKKMAAGTAAFNAKLTKDVDDKVAALLASLGGGSGGGNKENKAADAYERAAAATTNLAEAADKAANAIAPRAKKSRNSVIDFGDMSSRTKAQDVYGRAVENMRDNAGLSGFGKGLKSGASSDPVKTIQQYIDASPASKAMQNLRDKGYFGESGPGVATTKITLEMVTDVGKVAGNIFAEADFIQQLKRFTIKNTNSEARAVTI